MRRRSLTVGAIALACAIALTVSLVLTTGGGSQRPRAGNRSLSSGTAGGTQTLLPSIRTHPGTTKRPATTRPATTSPPVTASPGRALPTCAMPANAEKDGGWSLIATTKGAITRYATPGGAADGTIPATWYGGASAMPVIAQQSGWLEVRLATRPNGSTAWVRSADVTVSSSPYWISVDLATRHVTLFRLTRQLVDAPAGVGTGADPTPTGQYFVAFFESSPSAGYGPFIIVTSAHSTSIADWEGSGDAVIGIHGPLGADSLIGTTGAYLSHGCVRIPVSDLVSLRGVPAGSPISICG